MSRTFFQISIPVLLICICSCDKHDETKLFTIHKGDELGIDFQNTIPTNDSINALTFEYLYNGSGVGVADFNHDGLQDLFFGGNDVSSRLYLNQGNLKFKDVTEIAGVPTTRWVTGVSVVDINLDGLLDIYLCVAGKTSPENRKNILFLNTGIDNGMPHFREAAKDFGLDDDSYSTMAAFFDYDKDGDPDMYLVNNWLETFNRNNVRPKRIKGEAPSTDRLYRNNGNNSFTNVSAASGIIIEGYGLGINICDINQDTWPDVYVSNDFLTNDLLWINQHDGTFKNMAGAYLKHQTHNGMGIDIADFNNDALSDIVVVDMLPPGHVRQKLMTPGQNYDQFNLALSYGYEPQYMRNTLQLNRGLMKDGRVAFSEISFEAGIAQTDWSWAPLFADFDNDGWKDLFIANGYRRDVTNLDFIFFAMEGSPFGTPEARRKKLTEKLLKVPDVKLTNYIYHNNGSLILEDKTKEWGIELPTFSNGAAYADLDNDGDLDLITNNIDQEVIIYENQLHARKTKAHYLRLLAAEPSSFNQQIFIYSHGKKQFFEHTPYRGFQSTVENFVHAGLGSATSADSVIITWPDHYTAVYKNVRADTILVYSKKDADSVTFHAPADKSETYLASLPLADYKHQEQSPSDIKVTRTLLHELSRFGPCLAKGDVNADGLDDFLMGEEEGTSSIIFVQQKDGTFKPSSLKDKSTGETGDALFFDADGDHDEDLYIANASPSGTQEAKNHQLYRNDGKGTFTLTQNLIPDITTSASCVEGGDFDGDGDIDLFVGGRLKPNRYPLSARSYVLRNENGKFTDITSSLNPALAEPGMISAAAWVDIDNDHQTDLILTGEWQPLRIFKNDGAKFTEITDQAGLKNSNGWWNCITAADLNHDGFIDLIAGNTGKNSFFKPTVKDPVQLWAKDFDGNGSVDPIITYFNPVEKDRYIIHNRLVLLDQLPGKKKKFETFTQYARTPFQQVFSPTELEGAVVENAYKLESVVLINKQGKGFEIQDLPDIAQISTINDVVVEDINGDEAADLLIVGNTYSQETLFGRYDASIGTLLLGDNKFNWKESAPTESGWTVDGDARQVKSLNTASGKVFVVSCNNDKLQFFKIVKNDLFNNQQSSQK